MRYLPLMVLAACIDLGPALDDFCDAGRCETKLDAGPDAGVDAEDAGVDAGPAPYACDSSYDAGQRSLLLTWHAMHSSAMTCQRQTCQAAAPLEPARACGLVNAYLDAGCSVREDGGYYLTVDCRSMCDSDSGTSPCCERLPRGASAAACSWSPF